MNIIDILQSSTMTGVADASLLEDPDLDTTHL